MEQSSSLPAGVIALLVVLYVAVIGLFVWVYVQIIRKAGYSGWWVLMGLVPVGNLVMLCLFAFKEWPIRRELQYLRGYAAATGLPGYAHPQPYGQPPPGYGPTGQVPPPGPQFSSDQPDHWDGDQSDGRDGDRPSR